MQKIFGEDHQKPKRDDFVLQKLNMPKPRKCSNSIKPIDTLGLHWCLLNVLLIRFCFALWCNGNNFKLCFINTTYRTLKDRLYKFESVVPHVHSLVKWCLLVKVQQITEKSCKWWYKHQTWHDYSLRYILHISLTSHLKIQDGNHFSIWLPSGAYG